MAVVGKPLKIGKYDVVEHLGGGGMGDVYKAIDPRIGRTVAIKVIKVDFAQDPELLRRFDIEARAVGNLQHPNIVTVFDFGEENGSPYLVMQYLDGTPLDKVIAQRQNLPIIQKLDIIIGVLKALEYAHEHGVIHRDVKPANVHVLKDGSVKLLDFGIARQGDFTVTNTGQIMGTMFYMPPEQMNSEVVDRRGDIFSTGIMLFELLTYSLPFDARDQTAIIVQRLRGDPPPPLSKYFENYPLEMDDIITRAMMRDRDERYSRAEDFAFDLARIQERLKRDMASHFVDQARSLILAKSDLKKARDLLSEVVKIDTQNSTAKQLLYDVQQLLQKEQRVEKVHQLRAQAEDALSGKQFDQAANFVEQAIKMDQSDPDLLELREQVQEAKSRALQVKKLLSFANAALQSDQFEVAQKTVADALALDGSDTDAKVMQAAIARQLVEHEKRSRVQQLLQVARREISARQYEAARENISKAKAIDPVHPEISGLEKMAAAGQDQEKRRIELQQVCSEIERRLMENNLTAARDLSASSIRRFPGEERLVRLKAAADDAYEQQERRTYIEQQILSASRMVDEGQAPSALKLLQDTERLFPTDTRLLEYMKVVREAAAREAAEHEKKSVLLRARSALRRKSFAEAIDALERGLIQFPDEVEIRDLLDTSRQEFERLTQKKQVEEVSQQARQLLETKAHTDAINLLERTAARVSDPDLIRLLDYARQEAGNYRAGMRQASEQATKMLDDGRHAEALKFLETHAAAYGKNPDFQTLLTHAQRGVQDALQTKQTKQTILRAVEDARQAIQSGDMNRAEAILRNCQALSSLDAEVLALAVEIDGAKKALERRRQQEAERAEETQRREAEAGQAASSAGTKIFPSGPESHGFPREQEPEFRGQTSTGVGANAQRPAPTGWFQEPAPQPVDQPSTLDRESSAAGAESTPKQKPSKKEKRQKAAAHAEPPTERAVLFPKSDELGDEREATPGPGKNKKWMLIAAAVLVVIIAVVIVIKLIPRTPAEGYLKITGAPAGASVSVDDKPEGLGTDGLIKTSPGTHSVRVSADGYETRTEQVTVEASKTEPVDARLQLPPPPPPPPPSQGTLAVQSSDFGADVFVDGQSRGVTGRDRRASLDLDPGLHRIQLKKSGYQDSNEIPVKIVAKQGASVKFSSLTEIVSKTFLAIDSNPRGSSVRIDDKAAGNIENGPLRVKVTPGSSHSIQVSKEGYEPWKSDRVTVKENQEFPVFATLIATPGPTVASFVANPPTIKSGEKTQLRWETQHTADISIDHNGGTSRLPSGTAEVQPTETTTYTLTARGPGGSTNAKVSVTVSTPPPPPPVPKPTVSFSADRLSIEEGQQAILIWEVSNADEVSLNGERVQATGRKPVNPTQSTDFELSAKNKVGEASKTVHIDVRKPPPPPPPPGPGGEKAPGDAKDGDAIREAKKEFERAFNIADIGGILKIWPTIPGPVKANYEKSYFGNSVKSSMELSCEGDPKVTGDSAEWNCTEVKTVHSNNGGNQTPRPIAVRLRFKKLKSGNWVIDSKESK